FRLLLCWGELKVVRPPQSSHCLALARGLGLSFAEALERLGTIEQLSLSASITRSPRTRSAPTHPAPPACRRECQVGQWAALPKCGFLSSAIVEPSSGRQGHETPVQQRRQIDASRRVLHQVVDAGRSSESRPIARSEEHTSEL